MYKRIIAMTICVFAFAHIYSQQTFRTQDFSDKYYGKVYIEKTDDVFSPGWIVIKGSLESISKINLTT